MLAKSLQQPSVVPQRLISSIEVQDCLPESLTDKQILFSLCGKTCLLTTALPDHPVPAQTWMVWKQLSQLSFSGHAVKAREESQDSRVHLKQGRNCRPNTGLLDLFSLPLHCHKQTMDMGRQKFPEVQLSVGIGGTWSARAQMAFPTFSEKGS